MRDTIKEVVAAADGDAGVGAEEFVIGALLFALLGSSHSANVTALLPEPAAPRRLRARLPSVARASAGAQAKTRAASA